jgi:predicted nucleic acid-binding protein
LATLQLSAVRWAAAGLDFADALHLAQDEAFEAFVSFDKKLVRRARALESVEVRTA